jgi:DNA-binding NtrC family response regulator
MKGKRIELLLIEDNPGDARLVREMLAEVPGSPFRVEWVETLSAGAERSRDERFRAILLDLNLPDSHGLATFQTVHVAAPQLPIVVLSGHDDESTALSAVHAGAQDYLVKGQVDGNLLVRAIRYAMERKEAQQERERLIEELQEALANIRTLQGLLPICASCKKIRDDKGYWNQLETYLCKHSKASFTHGICPDCMERLYKDYTRKEN